MYDDCVIRLSGKNVNLCTLSTSEEAIKLYTKWSNDETINMWIGGNNSISHFQEEQSWCTQDRSNNNSCNFTIFTKEGKMIGTCSCGHYDGITAYIGITIGDHDEMNKGYGTEVISMLVKFAFEEQNAHRVALSVVSENARAIKCYTKVGFVECGRDHEAVYYHGHYCDNIHMEILRKEWKHAV